MVKELTTNQRIAKEIFKFERDHEWSDEEELIKNHQIFRCIHCGVGCDSCCDDIPTGFCYLTPRDYSGDTDAAWELVEFLRNLKPLCVTLNVHVKPERGFEIFIFRHGLDNYGRWKDEGFGSVSDSSLTNGIARAALIGVETCK